MDRKELKHYTILGLIIIGVCIIVKNLDSIGNVICLIFSALYPLILGAAIAFVFNIFLSFCEKYYFPKKKSGFAAFSRRPVCLTFSIALTLGLIALLINVVVPEFIKSIKLLTESVPGMAEQFKEWAIKKSANLPDIQEKIMNLNIDWSSILKSSAKFITVGAGGIISSVAGMIGAFTLSVTRIIIAIIFAVYVLLCKDGIKEGFRRAGNVYLSKTVRNKFLHIADTTNKTFKSFFVGQFTEAIILGTLCAIGMLILKLPYAVMTGTVVGVTALIPIVGAYIGALIGAFMIFTVEPMKALIFIIFLVILQQIEGNFIYPKVVGSSIGLPGIWVLAAVAVGGSLFGITGMLLGVPIVATVYKLVYEDIDNRESKTKTTSDDDKSDTENDKDKDTQTDKLPKQNQSTKKNNSANTANSGKPSKSQNSLK